MTRRRYCRQEESVHACINRKISEALTKIKLFAFSFFLKLLSNKSVIILTLSYDFSHSLML